MAEIWGVVVAGVAAAGSAAYGAHQASNASRAGADRASNESARQFDTVRSDTAGQRGIGNSALDTLASLYGWAPPSQAGAREQQQAPMLIGDTELPAGTTTKAVGNGYYEVHAPESLGGGRIGTLQPGGKNGRFVNDTGADIPALMQRSQQANQAQNAASNGAPNMGAFFASPDYQYNVDQSERAIGRAQASTGRFNSGRAALELQRNASGLASGEYNNFTQRLLQIAGLGSAGVQTSANAGLTSAGQIGAAQVNAGNNRASAYMQGAEGVNNAVQGSISNYMLYQYLNKPQQPPISMNSGVSGPRY